MTLSISDKEMLNFRIQMFSKAVSGIADHIVRLNNAADIEAYFEILYGLNGALNISIAALSKRLINGGNGYEAGNHQR